MTEYNMDKVRVLLMNKTEFEQRKGRYSHRKELLHSMQYAPYCKVEVYAQCLLGMLKIPNKKKLEGRALVLGFYVKEGEIILIDEEKKAPWYLERMKETEFSSEFQENQILLEFFNSLIEEEVPYLQKFEERITDLENVLLRETPRELPGILMHLRKDMMKLHAFYVQLIDIGEEMQGRNCELISQEQITGWGIFTNRVSRLHEYTENIRENLLQLHELYQAQIDIQQNETMAVLTVVTTIFLPLSLLAGWYGMNFSNIPLLNWKYGYAAVILFTVTIIGLELIYFRKKGFLKNRAVKKGKNKGNEKWKKNI